MANRIGKKGQSKLYPYNFAFLDKYNEFPILNAYSTLGNEELITLNSWIKEFFYNFK
ncbi:hypothetical protein AMTRI_Chr08g161500 [Amborella trichopoda]